MTPRKSGSPLKVVGTGGSRPRRSVAKAQAPQTVKAAADGGSRRELLVAMRTRIAADLDSPNTPPRDVASLSRRLLEIAKDIEALDAAENTDDVGNAAATPDAAWPAT